MAIQIPNVGTGVPADQTGDSPWAAMKKVADNFGDPTHAASRLVGDATGNVMQVGAFGLGSASAIYYTDNLESNLSILNQMNANGSHFNRINAPNSLTFRYSPNLYMQAGSTFAGISISIEGDGIKAFGGNSYTESLKQYEIYTDKSKIIYTTTTAQGANVVVDSTGKLLRSISSERYKEVLADVVLTEELYNAVMQLQPIVYRSTADADNSKHHYYSFSAEALGAFDPAFALWRDTEMVTDKDGNTTEVKLDERQAEGLNINALLALNHAVSIYQHKKQIKLESRIAALEQASKG